VILDTPHKRKTMEKNNVAGYDRARVHESMKAKQSKLFAVFE
jgi:hypothetical protein